MNSQKGITMSNRDIVPSSNDNRARRLAIGAVGVAGLCATYYFGFSRGQSEAIRVLSDLFEQYLETDKDQSEQ